MLLQTTATQTKNLWEIVIDGGFLMIPLAILLLISIYIFIERCLVISRAVQPDRNLMKRIRESVQEGDIENAERLCKKNDSPYSRLIMRGISRIGRPTQEVMGAIENTGNIEISRLSKGLAWLSTTAAGAPMIGFLGTVVGMMQSFDSMASKGTAVSITDLGGGISMALITTVAGLVVGILALFAYNYLAARLGKILTNMETTTMEFMDMLNEPAAL